MSQSALGGQNNLSESGAAAAYGVPQIPGLQESTINRSGGGATQSEYGILSAHVNPAVSSHQLQLNLTTNETAANPNNVAGGSSMIQNSKASPFKSSSNVLQKKQSSFSNKSKISAL